tara:strand:- start:8012 stop:8293 length:282 start_codon:yes stop_codon:yes gene_type:complete
MKHIETILKALKSEGINQAELCRNIDYPKTAFNEVIKGKRKISMELAFLLSMRFQGKIIARDILISQLDFELNNFTQDFRDFMKLRKSLTPSE